MRPASGSSQNIFYLCNWGKAEESVGFFTMLLPKRWWHRLLLQFHANWYLTFCQDAWMKTICALSRTFPSLQFPTEPIEHRSWIAWQIGLPGLFAGFFAWRLWWGYNMASMVKCNSKGQKPTRILTDYYWYLTFCQDARTKTISAIGRTFPSSEVLTELIEQRSWIVWQIAFAGLFTGFLA